MNGDTATNDGRERVYAIIGKMCPLGPRQVSSDARIIDDLGYNSIQVVELLVELEFELNLSPIREEDISGVETVEQLADLVSRSTAASAVA